jgi:PAS domain S-box-containing protein
MEPDPAPPGNDAVADQGPLAAASGELREVLGKLPLHDSLMLLAQRAAEILAAESTGLFLVDGDSLLLEASFGQREDASFAPGKVRVPIRPDGGLTGFIAHGRKLFRRHGEALLAHPAVTGHLRHTPSLRCDSLLAMPLLRADAGRQELIGLLRADNKRGEDGLPLATGFSTHDEHSIVLLANLALAAIESAALVERLIQSSPNGIIAVDAKGLVTEFNRKAEEMLGWSRAEVLATPVARLYADPLEPYRIGGLLRKSRHGQVRDLKTEVRSRGGETIPILHTSAWLLDAHRKPIGSVGYFADRRPQELMLRAGIEVGQAEVLDDGLHTLASMMVSFLSRPLCAILLMEPGRECLSVRAAYANPALGWKPRLHSKIFLDQHAGFRNLLASARPRFRSSPRSRPLLANLSAALGFPVPIHSLLVVPLRIGNRILGQVVVGETDPMRANLRREINLVAPVASQISTLADRMESKERSFKNLWLLHRISDTIQFIDNVEDVLSIILTGVTAGYGLGFNRAVLLSLDAKAGVLHGMVGIGEIEETMAREAWKPVLDGEPSDLDQYLAMRDQNLISTTTVGKMVATLHLELGDDVFRQVVESKHWSHVDIKDLSTVPAAYVDAMKVTTSLLVAPLIAGRKVLGLLVVDNKFTGAPITEIDTEALVNYATTAALAMASERRKLLSFYHASRELVNLQDPSQVAQESVELTRAAAQASWVSMLLIDAQGRVQNPIAAGRLPNPSPAVRDGGISSQVMQSGKPVAIDDVRLAHERVNPTLIDSDERAAICLPLDPPGKRLGVLWIHYSEPHQFPEYEVAALQLFASQVAAAYLRSQRLGQLERMREAAARIAAESEFSGVLHEIVASACKVLGAQAAFVWSYDAERDAFDHNRSAWSGTVLPEGEDLKRLAPRSSGLAKRILADGWRTVEDLGAAPDDGLQGSRIYELAAAVAGRRFQGVALESGGEKLGVICLIYSFAWSFDEEEIKAAREFAGYAALALKKARLFEQVSRTKEAAKAVARATVLNDGHESLDSSARAVREALECTWVAVGEYDRKAACFIEPFAIAGDLPEGLAFDSWRARKLLSDLLHSDSSMDVTAAIGLVAKGGSLSAEDGNHGVCMGTSLRSNAGSIGVMLVGYRSAHQFTRSELDVIELFADQAAIIFRNRQLFRDLFGAQRDLKGMSIARQATAHQINQLGSWIRAQGFLLRDAAVKSAANGATVEAFGTVLGMGLDVIDSHAATLKNYTDQLAALVDAEAVPVMLNGAVRQAWRATLRLNFVGSLKTLGPAERFELEDATTIRVVPMHLSFLLENVIQNALTAAAFSASPTVDLSTRSEDGWAEIVVVNNGRLIPAEILTKLFREPVGEGHGSGRGLLVAKAITDLYQGSIDCYPRAGQTWTVIRLPFERA